MFRNLDIYRDRKTRSAGQRALHLVGIFDSRRLVRVPPYVARSCWLRVGVFGAPTAILTWILATHAAPVVSGISFRWACGAIWVYTSIETLTAFGQGLAGLFGTKLPKLHDDPILSRTLREFWGRRWNPSVRHMLNDHCFLPLVTRFSPPIAVMGTFVASAFLHFWLTFAAVGPLLASSMATYFVIQGALLLLERRLAVSHWRLRAQRAWTAGCLLLPLPLFLEPLLRVVFP